MNTTASKIPPITMSKLYIGNLPSDMNEAGLRQLFVEQNLSCTNILVKRGGYAFVDCPDQSSADKAIDKLNGESLDSLIYISNPLHPLPSFFSAFESFLRVCCLAPCRSSMRTTAQAKIDPITSMHKELHVLPTVSSESYVTTLLPIYYYQYSNY